MQPHALVLKEHIQHLRPHMAALSDAFFQRLFALAPEIEGVFRDDPTARLTKFANMLATLANLKGWEALQPALRTLGRRHREYGVQDHYYGFGKHALLEALQDPPWGPPDATTEAAWRALLDGVIGLMLQGAPAGRPPAIRRPRWPPTREAPPVSSPTPGCWRRWAATMRSTASTSASTR
jgi:hemoglobin-like flavoprotein